MKRTLAVVLLAALGCGGKKDKDSPGTGTGGGTGTTAPADAASAEPEQRMSQMPQPTLPKLELPDDPKRTDKIALGHALFFDKRLSGKTDRACYSCHLNEDGNGGKDPIAIGSGDVKLTRHSPVIWNVGYLAEAFYWDGRAKTLEDNVKGAWGGGNMGAAPKGAKPEEVTAALDKKTGELAKIAGYKKLFAAAFPGVQPKGEHAIAAIAEYMRTMVCNDTAFDKYAAGDKKALDDQQQRGLDLFLGRAGCATCHPAPHFSAAFQPGGVYYNVGIGTVGVPEDQVDVGRMKVTSKPTDWAAFKIPTLRNIAKSDPYFHDGSVATLEEAVTLMAKGGHPNKNKIAILEDRNLTADQIKDLIAFLKALDCPKGLEEPKLP